MKNTQLLLINDMCGYGKVALSAMLPVLSHMGYRIHNLPTALVSDTLNYPKFYIHDTTEYVRQSLAIWEELGFEFDAISTGFIVTEEETRIISDFCHRRAQKGTKVFVDPIMGDNGKLYAGVPESTIGLMRHLLECADYAVPNYTEACLLADRPIAEQITPDEGRALVDAVRVLGAKSVVITSAVVDGANVVIGYDHVAGKYFTIPFDLIPVYFPGTGDTFSAGAAVTQDVDIGKAHVAGHGAHLAAIAVEVEDVARLVAMMAAARPQLVYAANADTRTLLPRSLTSSRAQCVKGTAPLTHSPVVPLLLLIISNLCISSDFRF